jgi:hypothetical protein
VISSTKLASPAGFSFVDLDVDWSRNLAYIGSRAPGSCVTVVDFANELAPVIFRELGPTTTPATLGETCLGVRLLAGGMRLALTSESANVLELWELGAAPRTDTWGRANGVGVQGPRRMSLGNGTVAERIFVARRNAAGVDGGVAWYDVGVDSILTPIGEHIDACEHNDVATLVARDRLLTGCWDDDVPVDVIDVAASGLLASLPTAGSIAAPFFWTAAGHPSRDYAFMGGSVGLFVEMTGTSPFAVTRARFEVSGYFRGADLVVSGAATRLFAVTASPNAIQVWDADTRDLIGLAAMPTLGRELYGIRADLARERAIAITNDGDFLVLDTTLIPTTTVQPTPY